MSSAIIKCIYEDDINIEHYCSSSHGSSGGTLLFLFSHKVFGIHKGQRKGKEWNMATYINQPIKEFNEKYNNNCNKINIISKPKNEYNIIIIIK